MTALNAFTRTQAERFQRHFALAGFGIEAQASLLRSRILVIGAGGLGSPVLTYLAAAGVGRIEVVDHDVVDRGNLHRQVIHSEDTIGSPKASSAAAVMRGLHPEAEITEHLMRITADNALDLVTPVDLVVDGSDNFATRYIVSDACEITGTPLISGSILRFAGQVSMFWSSPDEQHWNPEWNDAGRGPTYRDLYPEAPDPGEVPTCAEAGVLGVLPGVIGSLMATEAVKYLAGIGQSLLGRVLVYDALSAGVREFRLDPDPERPAVTTVGADVSGLGGAPVSVEQTEQAKSHESEASEKAPDVDFNPFTGEPIQPDDLTPVQFRTAMEEGRIAGVVDVREPWEHNEAAIGSAVNLPLMNLWQSEQPPPGLEEATPERPLVVYCAHGIRSRQALQLLNQRYPDAPVRNLLGGYELYRST